MAVGYKPLYVKNFQTGLVQSREEMILPEDAFPSLFNAYIWRERIRRKQGGELLGRLQRPVTLAGYASLNLLSPYNAGSSIVPGSINITDSSMPNPITWTDPGADTVLVASSGPNGSVNYATGVLTGPTTPLSGTFKYYPNLPVMGIRARELSASPIDQTVFFDTKFAYVYSGSFVPLPDSANKTWTGTDYNFFWTTNYWVNPSNKKLFWATNFSGTGGDPIRYYDGTLWTDFSPPYGQLNASATLFLTQCQCLLPFRGRLVAFNTLEGQTLGTSLPYTNRIRWSKIGNPLTLDAAGPPIVYGSWRDDVQGQGGFLNIPTNEDIISVGFVRDNLVVYCENSTWQLRYTGRTIAPFQIEKINSEFGSYAPFSTIQFDTSLLAFGDKGLIECDSFKAERFDIKIPDLAFTVNQNNNGAQRIQGIRQFPLRLAYWFYVDINSPNSKYPNRRLLYNYENDSWAIFSDTYTAVGQYQRSESSAWNQYPGPSESDSWAGCNFPWQDRPAFEYLVSGGNTQGFIFVLDQQTVNDKSLQISNITADNINATIITSPLHNLDNLQYYDQETQFLMPTVIKIINLSPADPFYTKLNNQIFGILYIDINNFSLFSYNITTQLFDTPVKLPSGTYLGGAEIIVLDNFVISSKKLNYMEQGQRYQLGYIDILTNSTTNGEFTLNVYVDYEDALPSNNPPLNSPSDSFFNGIIPTSAQGQTLRGGTKNMQRVFCATQGNFITLQYVLSNAQMISAAQTSDVQIDMQTIWSRPAGRLGITS